MCFEKAFHLILMHFYLFFQCFEVCFQKSGYFFKKIFFQIFDWSKLFFDQSKSCLKICVSLCLVRLIKPIFRSIEHRESGFLNMDLDFFKSFFKFSLSLRFRLGSTSDFRRFWSFLLQGFSLQTLVRPFYPSFCLLFSHFMHFHAFLIWEFRTMHNLGILLILAKSCVIDHWVLLVYCYIHDLCWKIWSIWSFVKNQNF